MERVMKKLIHVISIAFIVSLAACSEGLTDKLRYSTTHSYGSTYALQFISKNADLEVAFDFERREIVVKGLKGKYIIKFSEVTSIIFKANGASGMFIIQTSNKKHEISLIDKVDFNVFAEEMKSSLPDMKLEIL
jgi:hypothetical protein